MKCIENCGREAQSLSGICGACLRESVEILAALSPPKPSQLDRIEAKLDRLLALDGEPGTNQTKIKY